MDTYRNRNSIEPTKENWQTHVPNNDRPYIAELTHCDLDTDTSETTNVVCDPPEVVEKRMQDLAFTRKDIGSHNQIDTNSRRRK